MFQLKATHKVVKEYFCEVDRLTQLGAVHEGAVAPVFANLLRAAAQPFGWTLAEKFGRTVSGGQAIRMNTSNVGHCELHNGTLAIFATPPTILQEVSSNLLHEVAVFVRERNLGNVDPVLTDVVLSDIDVVNPDILSVSDVRCHLLTRENVHGAPDPMVEILSPATAERERTSRLDLFALPYIEEYWNVDPEAWTITVLLPVEGHFQVCGINGVGQALRSPTLAGFNVEV